MLRSTAIAKQPSRFTIKLNLYLRYIKVGQFLHAMTLLALIIFVISLKNLKFTLVDFNFNQVLWLGLLLFGSSVAVISQMDAYGRFQNYKQIKDKFYQYGFNTKLIRPFMFSKCQRDAILVAAKDFNRATDVKLFFKSRGYKWYHILPDVCLKHPLIVFKKDFWSKILFTRYYKFQNYYW